MPLSSRKKSDTSIIYYISKDKAIPLQAWTGPDGSRRLRLPELKIHGTWNL